MAHRVFGAAWCVSGRSPLTMMVHPSNCCKMKINTPWKRRSRFIHRTAAAIGSPTIERASKIDLVTILTAYQMMHYSFIDIICTSCVLNVGVLTFWCKYNYPQDSRHHETTSNQKSIKFWTSECIGGPSTYCCVSTRCGCLGLLFPLLLWCLWFCDDGSAKARRTGEKTAEHTFSALEVANKDINHTNKSE